jgi:hypothetical protein
LISGQVIDLLQGRFDLFQGWIFFRPITLLTLLHNSKSSQVTNRKPHSAQGYLFLGELYLDTGQREKALENLKKAGAMFKEMGMDCWLAKTPEVLDRPYLLPLQDLGESGNRFIDKLFSDL